MTINSEKVIPKLRMKYKNRYLPLTQQKFEGYGFWLDLFLCSGCDPDMPKAPDQKDGERQLSYNMLPSKALKTKMKLLIAD